MEKENIKIVELKDEELATIIAGSSTLLSTEENKIVKAHAIPDIKDVGTYKFPCKIEGDEYLKGHPFHDASL
ncbi:MAG: hypothetical protein MJ250_08695 [Alphaproteobacteria bacterium]|nr:hypothetical protein [Alphaproteobacteria bacterium]